MSYQNEFNFTGRIARKVVDSGRRDIANLTLRLPSTTGADVSDYPSVAFFGDNAERVRENFNVGDFVTVKGHVQTRRPQQEGTMFSEMMLVGDEVQAQSDIVEKFNLPADSVQAAFGSTKNEILLRGEITYATFPSNTNMVLFTMRVRDKNGRLAFPKLTGFGPITRTVRDIVGEDRSGLNSEVCVIAAYHTKTKTVDGERRRYQDLIVSSIAQVPSDAEEEKPQAPRPRRTVRKTAEAIAEEAMPVTRATEPSEEEDPFGSQDPVPYDE